jgi:type II secretory pathway component PulM
MSILESIKDNWQQRPSSEQRVLILVAVLMICSAFYLLVADPLMAWREKENKRVITSQREYTEMIPLVSRLQKQQSAGVAVTEGLAGQIDKSLQENGLSMRGFQPGQNNDARLRLSDVNYESLIQWLYDVEYNYSLTLEELSISQAKTAGLLMASIRVKQN